MVRKQCSLDPTPDWSMLRQRRCLLPFTSILSYWCFSFFLEKAILIFERDLDFAFTPCPVSANGQRATRSIFCSPGLSLPWEKRHGQNGISFPGFTTIQSAVLEKCLCIWRSSRSAVSAWHHFHGWLGASSFLCHQILDPFHIFPSNYIIANKTRDDNQWKRRN